VAEPSLKGKLLIAAPLLVDPNFHRTVVLVIEHSAEGALGVVLNRPTELPVADAVPELAELDDGWVFAGGPVQPQAVIALAEYADLPPEGAVCGPIAPIGVESDMDALAEQVTRVRVYAGYSGWGEGQLEGELEEDAWFDGALHASDRVKELTTVAKVEFDKRPAYQVKVVHISGVEQMEYYDVETGLQIGSESQRETPMGVLPVKAMLRDYTKFGGLMQPTVLIQSTMGIDQVIRISSYEYNDVAPTAFDPPPAIKALIK